MKQVVIDSRFYGTNFGIGRYINNLLRYLPQSDEIKVIAITSSKYHPYSLLSQIEMPYLLWKLKPDLVHIPHDAPPLLWFGKTILTIHDLTKLRSVGASVTTLPAPYYWFKHLGYRILLFISLLKAVHIITPTNFVKQDLVTTFKVDPKKISVTHEGIFDYA